MTTRHARGAGFALIALTVLTTASALAQDGATVTDCAVDELPAKLYALAQDGRMSVNEATPVLAAADRVLALPPREDAGPPDRSR